MKILKKAVLENHKRYIERIEFYRRYGYNLIQEREFIIKKSQPVIEPILEVGTGKGHCALVLAQHGYRFTTIDISEEDQRIAWLNLAYLHLQKRADFRIENAEQLSFVNNSFKTIFCINVFHHLANPCIVLQEMLRVCAHEGKIILSDFNEKGMDMVNTCHAMEGGKHDRSKHDLCEAETYFIDRGFKISTFKSLYQDSIIVYR